MTWEAFSASLVILSALSSVIVQAFFHMLHNHRHYQIENIVKDTGRHQGLSLIHICMALPGKGAEGPFKQGRQITAGADAGAKVV